MKKIIIALSLGIFVSACTDKEPTPTKSIDDVNTSSTIIKPIKADAYTEYLNGMGTAGLIVLESIF